MGGLSRELTAIDGTGLGFRCDMDDWRSGKSLGIDPKREGEKWGGGEELEELG